jgi:hypothetical protein
VYPGHLVLSSNGAQPCSPAAYARVHDSSCTRKQQRLPEQLCLWTAALGVRAGVLQGGGCAGGYVCVVCCSDRAQQVRLTCGHNGDVWVYGFVQALPVGYVLCFLLFSPQHCAGLLTGSRLGQALALA